MFLSSLLPRRASLDGGSACAPRALGGGNGPRRLAVEKERSVCGGGGGGEGLGAERGRALARGRPRKGPSAVSQQRLAVVEQLFGQRREGAEGPGWGWERRERGQSAGLGGSCQSPSGDVAPGEPGCSPDHLCLCLCFAVLQSRELGESFWPLPAAKAAEKGAPWEGRGSAWAWGSAPALTAPAGPIWDGKVSPLLTQGF